MAESCPIQWIAGVAGRWPGSSLSEGLQQQSPPLAPPPAPRHQHTPCLSLPQELGCDAGRGKASFLVFLNPEHWETRLLGGRNGGPNHVGNGKELESRAWAGAPNKGSHKDARPHKPHNRAEEAPLAVWEVPRLGHPWMLADTQQWSGQGEKALVFCLLSFLLPCTSFSL